MDALLKGFCQTLLTCRHKFYDGCPQQRKEDHTNGFHERSRFQWGSWEIKARGVQTYLLGLGYRESKVFSSLGFVLNTKTTLWQTPSLNLLVSNLAARPWMALWFLDGIFGCPTVAKLETFSKVGYMCRCETLQAATSPTKYWSSWTGSSWQAWSYMVKTTEMSLQILKTSWSECCDMKGNLDTPYEITFFIFW